MLQFQKLQEESIQIEQNTFKIIGYQGQPYSFVMFHPLNRMVSIFYDVHVTLIIQSGSAYFRKYRKCFQKFSQTELFDSPSVSDAIDHIKKLDRRKINIFISGDMLQDVEDSICHLEAVSQIICYDATIETFQQFNKRNQKFLKLINTENQLKEYLKAEQPKLRRVRHSPIMLPINQNNSILHFQTIMAMLTQKCDKKSTIKEFCKLVNAIHPQQSADNLRNFEKQLLEERYNLQQREIGKTLYTYIYQYKAYNVLNTLLQTSNKCTQLFYGQPYFKDLFILVKKIFQSQKTQKTRYFECYWGKFGNDEQIEYYWNNVGGVVQNKGFLLACQKIVTAEKLAKNLILKILVEDHSRSEELDYGYANISKYFRPPDGSAILFNPLNTFKIKSVEKIERYDPYLNKQQNIRWIHLVTLEYGYLSRLMKLKNELSFNDQEQALVNHGQYLGELRNEVAIQGDLFCTIANSHIVSKQNYDHLLGYKQDLISMIEQTSKAGIAYWQYYLPNEKQNSEIIKIKCKLGVLYCVNAQYLEAEMVTKEAQELLKQKQYMEIKHHIAQVLYSIGKLDDAYILQSKVLGKNHLNHIQIKETLANILLDIGKHQDAIKLYRQCLIVIQKQFGKSNQWYITIKYGIGKGLNYIGQYQDALTMLNQCMFIQTSLTDKTDQRYLMIRHAIAQVLLEKGEYSKAQFQLNQCFAILERIVTNKSTLLFAIEYTYAQILFETGRYVETEQTFSSLISRQVGLGHQQLSILSGKSKVLSLLGKHQQSLCLINECIVIASKSFGKEHPKYLEVRNILASIFSEINEYQKGLQISNECLLTQKKLFGTRSLQVTRTKLQITQFLYQKGQYLAALKNYEEYLPLQQKLLMKDHPECVKTKHGMVKVLIELSQYEKALEIIENECLVVQQVRLGLKNIKYIFIRKTLARILFEIGQYEQAIKIYEESLSIQKSVNHMRYLKTKHAFALCLFKMWKYQQAKVILEECLETLSQTTLTDNISMTQIKHTYADVLYEIGDEQRAFILYNQLITCLEKSSQKNHPKEAELKHSLTKSLITKGMLKEALKNIDECRDLTEKVYGQNHPKYIELKQTMASLLLAKKQYKAAISILKNCLKSRQKIMGKNHPEQVTTKYRMAQLLHTMLQLQQSKNMYKECLKSEEQIFGEKTHRFLLIEQKLKKVEVQWEQYKSTC